MAGCALILFTFMYDYAQLLVRNDLVSNYLHLMQDKKFLSAASAYIPQHYHWGIFWIGETFFIAAIVLRSIQSSSHYRCHII
jgi:hypothetical protein